MFAGSCLWLVISKRHTDYEHGKVDALCSKNLSEREIPKSINRSKTLVHNYLKRRNGNVFKKTRGYKKIINKTGLISNF